MNAYSWMQILFLFIALFVLIKPVGYFMTKVYQGQWTIFSPILRPCETVLYRLAGVDDTDEMDWKRYATAMLLFNAVGFMALFAILLTQSYLPLNPQQMSSFSWSLAFNTAVSFVTNTNWQAYSGEQAASYFTQMAGLAVQNFVSTASGMAVILTLIRGFVRRQTAALGNFWVDLTRSLLYILLPLSFVAALCLVSQGVIQNFAPYKTTPLVQATTFEMPKSGAVGLQQLKSVAVKDVSIPMGPVASQEAIKELGTNGGGFFNANSAHPYENPTPLSNFLECLLILLIPGGLTVVFGRMVGNSRQGWALLTTMMILMVIAIGVMSWAESGGNPLLRGLGVSGANLEGKEVRFGSGGSALFSALTTGTSCGAVNSMHDSFTPIGGMVPLVLILLGEVIFGGVGSGLYTMLAFVVIAVFIAGLMIGRTPEYLGKKIEVREMWLSLVIVLTAGMVVLIFSGLALILPAGVSAMANSGPHGLTEVLYAYASAANNNGSAFAGLNAGTLFYTMTTSLAMLIGRFVPAVAVLALAGSLASKKYVPPSLGTLPTDQLSFVLWLTLVIIIVGALTFFPALAMGPIIEHLLMTGGN
ncbi:MAG: potassium-transporting ATPase subunit KdpA [Desulfobulbaceae bacterium]|nr:potassium-transporting ATPase subunit KdpA [Desulfobulbaceae bacterium]